VTGTFRYTKPKRIIVGKCTAQRLAMRPKCIPVGRPRGIKAAGIRYEKTLLKALLLRFPKSGLDISPWYEYWDANGRGYCQPDLVVYDVQHDRYVIVEIKLTNYVQADNTLNGLYVPVLAAAHDTVPAAMIIVRHLSPGINLSRVHDTFSAAFCASFTSSPAPIWHYLGKGPI